MEGLGFTSLIGILTYGSYIITSGVAPPGLVSSTFYAFYVAMGFRSVVVTYTELLKVAGIYQGLDKLFPNIHDDPVYKNTPLLK